MTMSDLVIRPAEPDDGAAVAALLKDAFRGDAESGLVDHLRDDGDLLCELVALAGNNQVVGYLGLPRLSLLDDGVFQTVAGVAPLAVTPEFQRRGIGNALMMEGQARLREQGLPLVFVLGDPGYYSRFGFDVAAAEDFQSDYAGPHFMVAVLRAATARRGRVVYPRAFADLG